MARSKAPSATPASVTPTPVPVASKDAKATVAPVATAPAKKVVDAKVVAATKPVDVKTDEVVAEVEVAISVIDKLENKINALVSLVKEITGELKSVKKEYKTLRDKVDRVERKRAKAISNPNGFAKPCKIKTELCDFLAVPHGSEMSRTDVTRGVNAYIKKFNLNKPENKRFIVPDDKLRSLLGVKPTEEVSYFQLQRYLSPHFIKEPKVVPVVAAPAPT